MTTELQAEKHKNLSLQQQLEKLWASGQNVIKRYEAEISAARQQAAELRKELQNQTEANAARMSQQRLLEKTLRGEIKGLQDPMKSLLNTLHPHAVQTAQTEQNIVEELLTVPYPAHHQS